MIFVSICLIWGLVLLQSTWGLAYEVEIQGMGYFSFLSTGAELQFSGITQSVNISGQLFPVIAQTWLPADEYSPPTEETRLFIGTAVNEIVERNWFWNKEFLNYVQADLTYLLNDFFPEIDFRKAPNGWVVNDSSTIFLISADGDPRLDSTFNVTLACIWFNVTFLPPSMNYYLSDSVTEDDWAQLERWEETAHELQEVISDKWYITDCIFQEGRIILGGTIPAWILPNTLLVVVILLPIAIFLMRKMR